MADGVVVRLGDRDTEGVPDKDADIVWDDVMLTLDVLAALGVCDSDAELVCEGVEL